MLCNYRQRDKLKGESILCMNTCSFFFLSLFWACLLAQTRGAFLFLQHFFFRPFHLCLPIHFDEMLISRLRLNQFKCHKRTRTRYIIEKCSPQSKLCVCVCLFHYFYFLFSLSVYFWIFYLITLLIYVLLLCLNHVILSVYAFALLCMLATAFMSITCVKIHSIIILF